MKNPTFTILIVLVLLIGACTNQNKETEETSASERNKSLVIKSNDELFNKGNLSFADEVFDLSYRGEGPEIIKNFVKDLRTAFPDLQVSIDPIIAEGNMTAWRRIHSGTHQGEYMGFQPTNKKITWKAIIISEYDEDGKVTKEWAVNDLFEVLEANKLTEIVEE